LLSLRTLEILMDEVGLRDTVDPLAGSYFIETLTKQMEEKILEEMKEIQEIGGMVHAVATGFIQRKVAQQAYEYEKGVQKGEYIKVGVNKYADEVDDQTDVELHEYNERWVDQQLSSLKELRRTRNSREVSRSLKDLKQATQAGKNVMPLLVDCCRAYATVGEMAGVFRDLFGEWEEPSIF
jgi:methylmalonyl-CoA mutase N-terminal domain/subunit